MLTKEQAKADAWLAIADLMGREYFRKHFEASCHSYPDNKNDDVEYEYFIGFDDIVMMLTKMIISGKFSQGCL